MDIPDEDKVHRTIFRPFMQGADGMLNRGVFMFQERNGVRKESLIWDRYVTTPNAIHELGIKKETDARADGKEQTYTGYISAIAKAIKQISVNGHGFILIHEPEEGQHHIGIRFNPDIPDNKDRHLRNELKTLLIECFSSLVARP